MMNPNVGLTLLISSFMICLTMVVFPALSRPLLSVSDGPIPYKHKLTTSKFASPCPLDELFSRWKAFEKISNILCWMARLELCHAKELSCPNVRSHDLAYTYGGVVMRKYIHMIYILSSRHSSVLLTHKETYESVHLRCEHESGYLQCKVVRSCSFPARVWTPRKGVSIRQLSNRTVSIPAMTSRYRIF